MKPREIVFDTETTGLKPEEGHRIIQIGAIELVGHIPTGRTYMALIDPGRDIDPAAEAVHGISRAMLRDKPPFDAVVEDFLAFIEDAPLVAHNAEFDRNFLNAELERLARPPLPRSRFIDTLEIARNRWPGQKNTLDILCKRLGVDNSARERHDALLDCQILAEVYLELMGGRQQGLGLVAAGREGTGARPRQLFMPAKITSRPPRKHEPDEAERTAHRAFIAGLKSAIWLR
ncbi:MAG: DNA polymerase III subunit epsilon [Rhodothalassiaceae bacterium]